MGVFMKKVLVIILIFSLGLFPSVQGDLGVDVETQKYCSPPPAEFKIKITNQQDEADRFATIITDKYRSWASIPKPYIELNPGETKEVKIYINAPEEVKSGEYYLPVLTYSLTNTSIRTNKTLCLSILRKYDAKIISSRITEKVKPGAKGSIFLEIENIGTKDFDNLTLKANLRRIGELLKEKEETFSLEDDVRTKKEISFEIGKYQEPGKYTITVDLEGAGKYFGSVTKEFEVLEIENIKKEKVSEKTLFSENRKVVVENKGNTAFEGNIKVSVSKPWNLLVSTKGNPVSSDSKNQVIYSWYITLDPNSSKTIKYQINYWPLYLIFLIVIVVLGKVYFIWRSPYIDKRILQKGGAEEEKAEFTLAIEIVNRTGSKLKDTVVRDFVPGVAEVVKKFKSIKPKLNKKEGGTELVWRFKELEPGDERLLTYKIKTVVGTIDHFKLPKASLKTKTKDGKKYKKYSREVKVRATEIEE